MFKKSVFSRLCRVVVAVAVMGAPLVMVGASAPVFAQPHCPALPQGAAPPASNVSLTYSGGTYSTVGCLRSAKWGNNHTSFAVNVVQLAPNIPQGLCLDVQMRAWMKRGAATVFMLSKAKNFVVCSGERSSIDMKWSASVSLADKIGLYSSFDRVTIKYRLFKKKTATTREVTVSTSKPTTILN